MSLTSVAFLFGFLPVVVIGTHLLRDYRSLRAAKFWVLGASLAWYATIGWRYLPLLLASCALNWGIGRHLGSPRLSTVQRKCVLILGICVDVLILSVAKYGHFFAATVGAFIHGFPILPQWSFPLGLSFFTISQVTYLVDRYEELVPANSALDHCLFVSFFPNITAGPIERTRHFVGQLSSLGSQDNRDERLARSIMLAALGLFKKLVIADSFAVIANAGYSRVPTLSTCAAWATALAYAFQLYFDFSGYSDLAIGIASLLGIELFHNFDAPFRSRTIAEFWQRWHISLSTFITTYLYTPLLRAMGRVNRHKAAVAAVTAMTIAGFWHGPSWTYVLWGTSQGMGIAIFQYWKRVKWPLPSLVAIVITFGFTCVAMVLFRAPTVSIALELMRALVPGARVFGLSDVTNLVARDSAAVVALPIVFGSVFAFIGPTSTQIAATFRPSFGAAAGVVAVVGASLVFALFGSQADFLYRVF